MSLLELSPFVTRVANVNVFLSARHYLGPIYTGIAWSDEFGVMVIGNPTSRRLPQHSWVEIKRWCLVGIKNGGSQQFSRVKRWLSNSMPDVTTIVSYSDPSVGHTGSLYKACGFQWKPTWHRLKPPPSGNGSWNGSDVQSVKDRWVFFLKADLHRDSILKVKN
jgi:hypothetical protein